MININIYLIILILFVLFIMYQVYFYSQTYKKNDVIYDESKIFVIDL